MAVVGLGLMGGSLAAALRGQCRTIVGVDSTEEAVRAAVAGGVVDEATQVLAEGVHDADVVVLAVPVRTIGHLVETVGGLVREGCLVMDVGSTKAEVVAAMERLPAGVEPLGGHPMCGKEVSGPGTADAALYRGATFLLTPLARTSAAALGLGREIAEAVGARPLVVDAARQDALVATLSHLPYLLACSLVATADATTSADPAAWDIVASGFRDTSRVAGSDVAMWLDILATNRSQVLHAVDAFRAELARLAEMIEAGDEAALRAALDGIRARRKEMFP
ncbi:MAG TPA: prephenate dehydrogenase/arogenate dehydrogenase family protein [Anaerolineae bacterium]|nr:prephenate dehydrogenase/arogenate dehydrogenase family protein [Anaerolineae bacterium]